MSLLWGTGIGADQNEIAIFVFSVAAKDISHSIGDMAQERITRGRWQKRGGFHHQGKLIVTQTPHALSPSARWQRNHLRLFGFRQKIGHTHQQMELTAT